MNTDLRKLLDESRNAYKAMKANEDDSALSRWLKKPVLENLVLDTMETEEKFKLHGPGSLSVTDERSRCGNTCLKVTCPTSTGKVSQGNRSYAHTGIRYDAGGVDFQKYNRVSFWVYPHCPGFENVWITITLHNEGTVKYPRPKYFEGTHGVNVKNGCWNYVVWEIPYIYRDRVTSISISHNDHGSQTNMSDTATLYFSLLEMQVVEEDHYEGWNIDERIAFCHSGYKPDSVKVALTGETFEKTFYIKSAETGEAVYTGNTEKVANELGDFCRMDFSDFKKCGNYFISVGDRRTKPFSVSVSPYESAVWKTVNFFYQERCGMDIPGIHLPCHLDCFTRHPDGRTISVNGGWHDAGDLSQGQCNTSESAHAFLDMAAKIKGTDQVLYERLLDEARWGLEWMMRTRFGDGYRCVWTTIGIWTKNITGDYDDLVMPAYNDPFENFCGAGAEAAGSRMYRDTDPVFADYCLKCACEDFEAAYKFITDPESITPRGMPHQVQLYGQGAFAAAELYKTTKNPEYLEKAAKMAIVVMNCQQKEIPDWDIPLRGFFYQSESCEMPLAYEHRAHEQAPVMALALLCQVAPDHKDYLLWYGSVALYGEYIKAVSKMIQPYGLLPSAVYITGDEALKNLPKGHIEKQDTDYAEDYTTQVKNGIRLSDKYYLRRFPVAFKFRGFHGVLLTKAKAASAAGLVLGDKELADIAQKQIEWVLGNNPFAQSTMYGEGYDFAPMYSEFANDMTGELPVGIQTFENNDMPFYPMTNSATYKEVWVHSSSRFLWTVADIY